MKKNGFTIAEVLAVIAILGLIATIITPIIINITANASESVFKQSVMSVKKAAADYVREYQMVNIDDPTYPIIFTCDGTSCKDEKENVLSISGKIPTSGKIIIEGVDNIYFESLSNGTFYVSGHNDDLTFTKDASELTDLPVNKFENYKFISSGEKDYTSSIVDLGIPLLAKYPSTSTNDVISRNVWDLKLFDNRLYIGSGDFDHNTGPVDLYYYDLNTNKFVKDHTFNEEQINRFTVIDNKLVIPGIDTHTGGWEEGYYYVLENNTWVTKKVPNAIHVFDVVKFKNEIFVGIGNDSDSSILKSSDNGYTFTYVYMYDTNNNKIVVNSANSGTTRVYDLFVQNNKLYAWSNQKIFEYDETNNKFTQISMNFTYAFGMAPNKFYGFPIQEKLVFKGKNIIANGGLAISDDITNKYPTYTYYDKSTYVSDILVYDNELYVLCNMQYNGEYYVSVFKSSDASRFRPLMRIKAPSFANTFEYDGENFYFGIGVLKGFIYDAETGAATYMDYYGPDSGRILKVKVN